MSKKPPQQLNSHLPVLLEQVVDYLSPRSGEAYLDLTAGYGGHARAILSRTQAPQKMVLVDRDKDALATLTDIAAEGGKLVHSDYATYAEKAAEQGIEYDMILVDLGVSSPQLDRAERGFSLKREGPLDMRMDQNNAAQKTAGYLINHMNQAELERVLEIYGEEPLGSARRIARAIIAARPLETTQQLADVILSHHRGAYKKTHPATRTFQAFRIAVNDELGQLERLLTVLPRLLRPGGRVVLISFHSLEDRLVKRFFKEQASAGYEAELDLLEKKAVRGKTDDVHNPRARSAMLRAAVKK
ncbi:16S rRNA (cytosine(1402)-N(4))-methyltransferase RsmH [Candidatus Saccharibacteria bacterium]|nr:16S rRNA (cytosine(1402)-N(4))-methyltransferase RsmH [Candidatus Saccharibacteria bacterium]